VHSTRPGGELRPVELHPPLVTFVKYGQAGPTEAGPLAAGPDGSLYLVPNAALRVHPDCAVVALLGGGMDNWMADQPIENWSSPTDYTSTVDYSSRPASRAAAISTGTAFGRGEEVIRSSRCIHSGFRSAASNSAYRRVNS
jgi:hypothetical protein